MVLPEAVLRAVLLAVALMFVTTSIPDAEAGRKPAATSKKKTAKKRAAKQKRVAKSKRAAKKKSAKKKKRSSESSEPRRPLP